MIPRVCVVVVTYRSAETIGPTLDLLRRASDEGLCRVVIVDNQSPDGTRAVLGERAAWARVILNEENAGFGRGCNLGATAAREPFVLFLNPDAMMDSSAIECLVSFMESHEGAGIVGPATVKSDGELQRAGGMPSPWSVVRTAIRGRDLRQTRREIVPGSEPFRTDWICGAALMIRRDLFEQLGGFDPRYFLYFEETDLCRRAARRGAEIWAVPGAVARHEAGGSTRNETDRHYSGCIAEHFFESRFYFLRKHYGWIAAALAELGELGAMMARAIVGRGARELLRRRLRGPILHVPPIRERRPVRPGVTEVEV